MTREEAIKLIDTHTVCFYNEIDSPTLQALHMAIEALQTEPTKAVPPSLADVYKWERDIALSQLEEYGIGFAEKKRDDVVEVVRCKDCIRNNDGNLCDIAYYINEDGDGFCNCGERKEPLPQYEEWQDEFNKMCEGARPKNFVADEWYRDTFKGEEE